MANVLNRTTLEYLQSVNTPDFPEQDWIINPDLSSVEGVSSRYWKIDGDSVIPMTAEEQAAFDTAHPVVVVKYQLADGTPCYMYDGEAISMEKITLQYDAKTSSIGARDFYLSFGSLDSYNNGYVCCRNAIITRATFSCLTTEDMTYRVYVRNEEAGTESYQDVFLSGAKPFDSALLNMRLNKGDRISVFVTAGAPITNPYIVFELHWRD
jgi:hypothetical protein